jgi:hypothetical protein
MRWTSEQDSVLAELWKTDMPAAEIAEAMGVQSRHAVIGRAHRLKLPARSQKYIRLGSMPAEERDGIITDGYERGLSVCLIAEILGFSTGYVKHRASALRLKHKMRLPAPAPPAPEIGGPPSMPYVPGLVVTGRYRMVAP